MLEVPRALETCNPTSCPLASSYLSALKTILDSASAQKLNESEASNSSTTSTTMSDTSSSMIVTFTSSTDDGMPSLSDNATSTLQVTKTSTTSSSSSTVIRTPIGAPTEDATSQLSQTSSSSTSSSRPLSSKASTSTSESRSIKSSKTLTPTTTHRETTLSSVIRNPSPSSRTSRSTTTHHSPTPTTAHQKSNSTSTSLVEESMSQPAVKMQLSTSQPLSQSENLTAATSSTGSATSILEPSSESTGVLQGNTSDEHSFLDNSAASAGIFTGVGIVTVLIVLGIIICCRRRARMSGRRKWNTDTSSNYPFAQSDAPNMRSISSHRYSISPILSSGQSIVNNRAAPMDPQGTPYDHVALQAALPPALQPAPVRVTVPPLPPASGRSSPSLYPPSTHESIDDDDDDGKAVAATSQNPECEMTTPPMPPPRPARSALRNTLSRQSGFSFSPPSPPQAQVSPISNHQPNPFLAEGEEADYQSPPSSLEGLYSKPTLLSVKRRSSHSPI